MDKKKVFFLGGCARSGSTILSSILGQNPQIHSTTTSGNLGMIVNVRNFWHQMEEFRSQTEAETERRKLGVLKGMFYGYFDGVEQPIAIDKGRGWLAHMELAKRLLDDEPRVIVPVRNIKDVLCSFEKLYRLTKGQRQLPFEKDFPVESQTMEGRCFLWARRGDIVGSCVERIRDAVTRGWRKNMLFVEYEKLTEKPKETLEEIYDFLKLPSFQHDFDHIDPVGDECDLAYGWVNLHTIRPKLAPQQPSWPILMSKELAAQYKDEAHFWRKL